MPASLKTIVHYCDERLSVPGFPDYDGAVNGLQVENSGRVSRIAAAVDASHTTIQMARRAAADLLVVHHGLFWGPSHPWTGRRYATMKSLIEADLAVYSVHLPLDAHPKLGNSALLCNELGFRKLKPFFLEKTVYLGWRTDQVIERSALQGRLEEVTGGNVRLLPGGPSVCRKIGVVTGGAGSQIKKAALEGVDTFITGEGPHHTFALAEDFGINVFYAGHYATETFGVKALAEELSRKFKVPWLFLDHPSGL